MTPMRAFCVAPAVALALFSAAPARAVEPVETPMLAEAVAEGQLPPVAERLPDVPLVVDLVADGAGMARVFGFIALVLASVNIFGGFLVTQRMLSMYKKKQ